MTPGTLTPRTTFVARLVAAGPTRTMGGAEGAWVVTAGAIRAAVDEGLFRGLPCFVDHAAGHPSVRSLLGMWHDVVWDEAAGAAVGRLVVYDTAETRPVVALLEQMLAGDGPRPPLGISIVHYPLVERDGRTIRAFSMVESADVVMFPASEGSVIVRKEGPAAFTDSPGFEEDDSADDAESDRTRGRGEKGRMKSERGKPAGQAGLSRSEQVVGATVSDKESGEMNEELEAVGRVEMVAEPVISDQ